MIVRSKFIQLITLSALVVVATVIAACSSEEEATIEKAEASGKLVSSDWMLENLDNEDVVVVDLRKEEDYAAGHIPGAIQLTPKAVFQQEDENGVAGMLPAAAHIATALSELGIEPSDTVVFYDSNSNLWASRALWAMDVYGHSD